MHPDCNGTANGRCCLPTDCYRAGRITGSQVRSGSSWPLSGNCTEKQLPTDTPRPTASFDPCHRPLVPRRACVEPRPLVQTGPQGDSLPACGTRRRRRPSRLERARRREAHWTVVASPPRKRPTAEFLSCCQTYVVDRNNSIAAHYLATTRLVTAHLAGAHAPVRSLVPRH